MTKLDKCLDRQFISPIVITVKRTKQSNSHKNKYQMPKIDLLLENIAQVVKSEKSQQMLISTLDLRYAYSQVPLDKSIREQCISASLEVTPSELQTGFVGLTDIPAELEKAIDLTLTNCTNTNAYLYDKLIVTKCSTELYRQTFLTKLDVENLAISLDKCKFMCKQVEWLGYAINSERTQPLIKTKAIQK